ncbi:hypothetical protein ACFST9_05410 [Hymenobacter monticola]|uniref:Uncharacterized protein n=1 Tax=Hymenobacter monticola TaxID=1705399 RepID=A0ABY4BDG1_9BACT|nr:hypothetical protein [Hymenobacter monticola]UOE36056.1 hypothetical protein MTP16_10545 [Hymenobacter monticola]
MKNYNEFSVSHFVVGVNSDVVNKAIHTAVLEVFTEKLKAVTSLKKGWKYGEGESISDNAINYARRIFNSVYRSFYGIPFDLFPIADGGISLVFRNKDLFFEFIVEPNGNVELVIERGVGSNYDIIEEADGINVDNAVDSIRNFIGQYQSESQCSSYEYFTPKNMTLHVRDLLAVVSGTHPTVVEYPSYVKNALLKPVETYVHISEHSISQSPATQFSSGFLISKKLEKLDWSKKIAHQVINAI